MARAKTPAILEEKRRAKDKRLRKKFGITLEDFDRRAEEQEHKCKCCGGPLYAYGPAHVDHYHFYVEAQRAYVPTRNVGWTAVGYDEHRIAICIRTEKTKVAAIAAVKAKMMPWSVRGLCCFKCNRGMGVVEKMFDAARTPDNLLKLRNYYLARLNLPLTRL